MVVCRICEYTSLYSTGTARIVKEHGVEAVIQFCGRDAGKNAILEQKDFQKRSLDGILPSAY